MLVGTLTPLNCRPFSLICRSSSCLSVFAYANLTFLLLISLLVVVSVRREVNMAPRLPGMTSSFLMEVGREAGVERSVEIGGTED